MKWLFKNNKLDNIVEELRKYPFTEKMLICQTCSTKLMKLTHLEYLNTPNVIFPWELEAFAEFSLFADGADTTRTFSDSDSAFIKIINLIRNHQHPYLRKQKNMSYANAFMMATGLQQFKSQENILDRLYRYNFFWNFINDKINMQEIFSKFFNGLDFSEFRNLSILIYFYASLNSPTASIIRALALKYRKVVEFLKISRDDYKKRQSTKIDDNFENSIFCFNYLHPYPFVEYENFLFLPLPYLIIDAVTESILTRVTYDNNLLREQIGKEVAQAYIEKIFKKCNIYEEILPECTYYVSKKRIDSPDILIRHKNQICLIDTKLSTPKLEIRKFNTEQINNTIQRYAKNVIQVYNRLNDLRDGYYYPFEKQISINRNDIFGIVALLEDSYIMRRQIYQEVFNILGLDANSEEAQYINSNIKITNFRDLELFAFCSYDIFISLTKRRDDSSSWNDLGIFNSTHFVDFGSKRIPSVNIFTELCQTVIRDSIEEFTINGIISDK